MAIRPNQAFIVLAAALASAAVTAFQTPAQPAADDRPPRILLDAPPRAVEYQLGRLSNAELVRVERKEGDPRYRPVYYALLTRKGVGREYFDEALAALAKLDNAGPTQVLLEGLGRVRPDDEETADKMVRVLLAQPEETLRKERGRFAQAVESAASPFVLRAAYGGLLIADGKPQGTWEAAAAREGHLIQLLRSIPSLGGHEALRAALFDPIATALEPTRDRAVRLAAIAALPFARADAAAFTLLSREILQGDAEARAAAVRALQRIPESAWPATEVEALARTIVKQVGGLTASARTELPALDAIQLGEKLAGAVPGENGRALHRELRALGVQVVRVETIPEQMAFDVRWFAVEAGKPVQIVLYNPDAMSHNLLVTRPGSLKEVGMAASAMSLPSDPKVKPYVPDSPLVLHATRLLNWAESERLAFAAPKDPGEYPFVCTFPGHWVRMYGVMLVVPSLEAWEANRTVPTDPMTGKPFGSQRSELKPLR